MVKQFVIGAAVALATGVCVQAAQAKGLTSNVFGTAFEPMVMSTISGDNFDLQSLDLALGPFNPPKVPQTEILTGTFADSSTASLSFKVGYFPFKTFNVGWTGLTSVSFAPLADSGYLGFDNIRYSTGPGGPAVVDYEDRTAGELVVDDLKTGGMDFKILWGVVYGPKNPLDFPIPVPEPATWSMLLLGFFGAGALIRRGRRQGVLAS